MALTLSAAAVTAMADALGALLDGGAVHIFSGARPATPTIAITTQTLLATVPFASPAFGAAVAGVITAHPMTDDADCAASGTAAFFRAVTSGGDPIGDGSVGTSDADCLLSSTSILQHGVVSMTSVVLTVPSA